MAAGYIPLPGAQYPANAKIDFKPINDALSNLGDSYAYQHTAMLQDKQNARADEDQGMQRTRLGMAEQQFSQEQDDRVKERFSRAFQVIDSMPEGQQRAEAHARLLKSKPGGTANLDPMYLDPMLGPKRILAEAGKYDPLAAEAGRLDMDYKRSQIAENNAQAQRATMPPRPRLPTGMQWSQDGSKAEAIPGVPAAAAAAPKDYQTKDAMWAERLMRSEAVIDKIAGIDETGKPLVVKGADGKERRAYNPAQNRNRAWPDDSWFNSGEWKTYQQAMRESLAAILRKDTGAAVTQSELDIYVPMYFPLPGEPPEAVLNKKRARMAAAASLKAASGPAWAAMYPNGGPAGVGPSPTKIMGGPAPQSGPPPEAVQELAADPSPEAIREFEEAFGVSALDYIGQQ